jgi:sulfatase modifying factor 1
MKYALAPAIAFVLFLSLPAAAITIDTVPVGNPGNSPRLDGGGLFGSVSSSYRIATTEVTNSQYVSFLNAVAATDLFGLYNTNMGFSSRGGITRTGSQGSFTYSVKADVPDGGLGGTNYTYGDKPVVYTSWYDAARFANWVNNGATVGASTETGAYTITGGVSGPRNNNATWFLPTENEWYKAAYYNGAAGVYYNYPTKSNAAPDNHLPANDSSNSANYYVGGYTQDISYPFTSVGAYALSKSPYGTADQGGNVFEWVETYGTNANGTTNTSLRIRRGGSSDSEAAEIISSFRESKLGTTESDNMGFRLATIATAAGVPGDYNANGVVDAADYVLWRKYSGQSITLPNDSTAGTGPGDYTVWRSHFGQTSGAGSSADGLSLSLVPEPSCCFLMRLALTVSLSYRGLSRKFAPKRSKNLSRAQQYSSLRSE